MSSSTALRPRLDRAITLEIAVQSIPSLTSDDFDNQTAKDLEITGVTVDSSDVEPGWIFVAIPGLTRHGIDFASAAITGGARAIVTDTEGKQLAKAQGIDVPIIAVDDPRSASAIIAKEIYEPQFSDLTLVGVTGTNGKTTTAYLIKAALTSEMTKVGIMGTMEIDVSDQSIPARRTTAESPVIYRALATAHQADRHAVVIETSAHALSLGRVNELKFDSVVFTNLQHDHLDYYQTMERYFAAKADLFSSCRAKQGVICVDDEWGQKLAATVEIPVLTVSALTKTPKNLLGSPNHWHVENARNDRDRWGVSFDLVSPTGESVNCLCPIPGLVNVQNAAVAILSAFQAGVSLNSAIEGVANAPSIAGRMEIVPSDNSVRPRVLVDYAHTPEALQALLETVRPLVNGKLVLVFGTDGDRDITKREELAEIGARLADDLWVTDENPRWEDAQSVRDYLLRGIRKVRPQLENTQEILTCRRDAVREAIIASGPEDLVVITGKGAEREQEIRGVYHDYSDSAVAREVLAGTLPKK